MRISFARHGESVSNAAGRWQGQSDVGLSSKGREQALLLARRLKAIPFDLVVASDLSRASDTAQVLGRPVELDRAFREIDVGAWEGLSRSEVQQRYGDDLAAIAAGDDRPLGGGESWGDVYRRANEALRRLIARLGPEAHALVVTHGGWMRTLFAGVLGARQGARRPLVSVANTGICTLHIDEAIQVERYNDALHLVEGGVAQALYQLPSWTYERVQTGDSVVTLETTVEADGPSAIPEASTLLHRSDAQAGEQLRRCGPPSAIAQAVGAYFPESAGLTAPAQGSLTVVLVGSDGITLGSYAAGIIR